MNWRFASTAILGLATLFLSGAALALEEDEPLRGRNAALRELSAVLGAVHYLRGSCAPGESEMWRNRFRRVLDAERPSMKTRQRLIEAFNDAFFRARTDYPQCTSSARAAGVRTLEEGATLVKMLAPADPDAPQANSLDGAE